MSDISIQFHSNPEELASLVSGWVGEFSLAVAGINLRPFRVWSIDPEKLGDAVSIADRIALFCEKPDLHCGTEKEFIAKNPERLVIEIGKVNEKGLAESWLTARDTGLAAFTAWKKVAKRLKVATACGAVAINPSSGARAYLRSHRYTRGALQLQERGMQMLPVAGRSRIVLGGK